MAETRKLYAARISFRLSTTTMLRPLTSLVRGLSVPGSPRTPSPEASTTNRNPSRSVLGPCRNVEHGRERSLAVSDGAEEPQVVGPLAQAAGMMQAGDSDCGPEGQACQAEAADGQQSTAVGINTAAEESWRIIGGSRPMHLFSPAGFHRSLPVFTPSTYRLVGARWI